MKIIDVHSQLPDSNLLHLSLQIKGSLTLAFQLF